MNTDEANSIQCDVELVSSRIGYAESDSSENDEGNSIYDKHQEQSIVHRNRTGHTLLNTPDPIASTFLRRLAMYITVVSLTALTGFLAYFKGIYDQKYIDSQSEKDLVTSNAVVSRIAFGSCTSKGVHDDEAQPIWTNGVIASKPDAWIWLGDFAYLDYPSVNCIVLPNNTQCNCMDEQTAFTVEPFCLSGDEQHSLLKYQTMLQNTEYRAFLEYMCPGAESIGLIPPPGTNPDICPRPILGTWDDHDYGWNDGNELHPNKVIFKQLFLDAIGEDMYSPRRNMHRGIWDLHTFNKGVAGKEIDVFLLDERYHRQPLPCHVRREWCELEVLIEGAVLFQNHRAWCEDFLYGGLDGSGTCCKYDEEIQLGWCKNSTNQNNSLWEEACNISSPLFGSRSLIFDSITNELRRPDGTEPMDVFQDSPFCEVLGREQREWLKKSLETSTAALKIIASGSVLLGKDGIEREEKLLGNHVPIQCSNDDWDCYNTAQRLLLDNIDSTDGCTLVLTGDYHYGDIKMLRPGFETLYSDWLGSANFKRPIMQIMASGMSLSTAVPGRQCESYLLDPAGLRVHPECDIFLEPNFGLLDVKWTENNEISSVSLEIRDTNGIIRLQAFLALDKC